MRIGVLILMALHGLIHLAGFMKAFGIAEMKELNMPVPKPMGILWGVTTLLFVIVALMYGFRSNYWWIPGIIAVVMSQILIVFFWSDAKYGTIANVIILFLVFTGYKAWHFETLYSTEVAENIKSITTAKDEFLTENDLVHLPELIRNYIIYSGALQKPKVKSLKAVFEAEMRGKNRDWFALTAEQHNFFEQPTRLFFLKADLKGLPARGYHKYEDSNASMRVKLLSTFPVVSQSVEEMYKAETVTFFNDMCFLAPATLIDNRISWEPVDSSSVKATFSNRGIAISAVLYFNKHGQLINFISNDRYDVNEMKQYTFSTPLSNYNKINGYNLANYGEAIWHYPEGEFVYGKFTLKEIHYNPAVN